MELLLKNVQKKHLTLIAELAKTLNIDVEKDPYDPAFVAKILKGDKDFKEGKGVKVNIEDLWK
jgi:hypothetical protein